MKLKTYLEKTRRTASSLALEIGVYPSTITRIIHGESVPDWTTMEAIHAATGGRVRPNDFAGFL